MFPAAFWTPLTCFAAVALVYALGEFISVALKGVVSGLIVASFLFMFGFWLNIFPADITTKTGLLTIMNTFGIALLITNLGTMIDLEDICMEWKTVVIALSGFLGIAAVCFTAGTWMFGREYALTAAAPISGGTIAGVMTQAACTEAGRPELAGFAVLVLAMQKFFGMPVATICLRKDLAVKLANGDFDHDADTAGRIKIPNIRFIPELPKKYMSNNVIFATMGITAVIAYAVGMATKIPGSQPANYYLNPNIAYLIFGLIATRIGFLQKNSLPKSQSNGIMMFGLMCMLPGSLASITPAKLFEMLPKLVGLLGLCTVGICICCVLFGKMLGYTPYMSMACGCTCMFGYPGTELLTNETIKNMENATDEQKARANTYLMPKMIVAGFTTVTIASVAFAGIVAPLIFA